MKFKNHWIGIYAECVALKLARRMRRSPCAYLGRGGKLGSGAGVAPTNFREDNI
jgi:hypothetical protein